TENAEVITADEHALDSIRDMFAALRACWVPPPKDEGQFDVHLEWLPYTLDIPSYLGSARLDQRGEVVESSRNAHQWRRVRYSYMDCRRQARKRGLVILGTRKIWDSSLAAIGMLWAKRQGKRHFRAYHDRVFERF